VRIHASAPVVQLEGDGRVQRAVLANGKSLDCDFAVAAVGMHVNKDILRSTSLAAERAILVDSQCRTNIPDIFAAGDCAAVFDPLFGKHRNMDHSNSAEITGRIAGTNMAGGSATFDTVSEFTSEVFDLTIRVWGEGRFVDRRIMREITGSELPDIIEFGVAADGRVAQIVAVGHSADSEIFSHIVRTRLAINGNQERLKDPTIPLERAI
jgi:NADPH-dependent 2,4-dienoyl-CoA reductase/sulfur reductase-like enzyme